MISTKSAASALSLDVGLMNMYNGNAGSKPSSKIENQTINIDTPEKSRNVPNRSKLKRDKFVMHSGRCQLNDKAVGEIKAYTYAL